MQFWLSVFGFLNVRIILMIAKIRITPSGARAMTHPRDGTQGGGRTLFHINGLNITKLNNKTACIQ